MHARRWIEPAAEPVTLAEAKAHCRVEASFTDDDVYIASLIPSARQAAEQALGRTLVGTSWLVTLDDFNRHGDQSIALPWPRVTTIVSVKYIDADGALQTMPAADYQLDNAGELGNRLAPVYGGCWPTARSEPGAVRITYTAGFTAPATADAAADTISVSAWDTLAVGDPVVLCALGASGATMPGGLTAGVTYYVQSVVSAGVYTLAASAGGAAIDITSAGTGVHVGLVPAAIRQWILRAVASAYAQRETVADKAILELPRSFVDGLLDPWRVPAV